VVRWLAHPARRLNPPLPVDEHGTWYQGDAESSGWSARPWAGSGSGAGAGAGAGAGGESDGGLTAAERAILADIDQA
jgi:hypothetical protein